MGSRGARGSQDRSLLFPSLGWVVAGHLGHEPTPRPLDWSERPRRHGADWRDTSCIVGLFYGVSRTWLTCSVAPVNTGRPNALGVVGLFYMTWLVGYDKQGTNQAGIALYFGGVRTPGPWRDNVRGLP